MTEQEKNIIKNEIMDALLYGSKTIDQLTLSSDISDADLFEISGGRAITYSTLKAAIAASITNGGGSGSGHTHANKVSLDQIATDSDGYIHLTYPKRVLNEATKEYETIITTEKVKAGYADKAGDLTEDSPVLKLINTIGNQFVPTYLDGSTYVDTTWAEIVAGTRTLAAIKSVKGFFSDSFVSARGANSAGGGSTGGAYYLSELLDTAISNPSSGQALVYNGSKWVNSTVEQNEYILPAASASTLGGVKVGATLAMANGVLDQKAGIVSGGVYPKVTVDTYGRVTAGELLAASDIPNLPWSKITSGTPTTIAGYGITDTYTKTDADNRFVQQSLFDSMFAKESDGNGGFRIKAKYGLYSDSFISARGVNPDGGGSGGGGVYYLHELLDAAINNPSSGQALIYNGTKWVNQAIQTGLDETALAAYLTTHSYATQSWVESKGYLTAHQSLANYVTLDSAQNITANKVFYGEQRFVSSGLTYTDPWSGIAYAIKVTGKVGITDSIKAASFIKSGGTASQFLKADGSVDGNAYLTTASAAATYVSKAGDTMTGALRMGQSVASAPASQPMALSYGRLQCYGTLNINGNTDNSGTEYVNITAGHGLSASTADGLSIGTNTLTWQNQTVWHAGNDGAGSGLDADLLDGYQETSYFRSNIGSIAVADIMTTLPGNRSGSYQITQTGWNGSAVVLYAGSSNSGLAFYRPGGSNSIPKILVAVDSKSAWTDKGTIVTTSEGNAPSATKLQTARTLWGQSFNGTANVSGDMSGVGNITASGQILLSSANTTHIRALNGSLASNSYAQFAVGKADSTYNRANLTYWHVADGSASNYIGLGLYGADKILNILGSGNVGIGTTAPAYKLDVNGTARVSSLIIGDITLSYDAANGGLHVSGGGLYADSYISGRGANTSGSGSTDGAYYLSDLFDTTISNPTTGQALVYNGLKWVNGSAGLNETQLAAYLTTNAYATQLWTSNNFARALYGNDCNPPANLGEWMNLKTALGSADVKVDAPNGNGWYNVIQIAHRNGVADGPSFVGQIALGMTVALDRMFFRTHRTRAWKEVITAHQSLANYVTLNTTQTITGLKTFTAASTTAIYNSTGNVAVNVVLKTNGTQRSSIGWYSNFVFISNEPNYTGASTDKYHRLGITDGGVPQFWTNRDGSKYTLLHEGNYTSILDARYVTALGTSGNYLTWIKNGATNNITVPYATTAAQLTGSAEHTGTALADFDNAHTYTCQATSDLGDGISYSAILTVSGGSQHRFFQIIGGKGNPSYLRWRTTDANGAALGAVHRLLDDANYSSVLDSRYYTESEADARFVNVSGDTMTGLLTAKVGSSHSGIKLGNTYITAINGDTILQNNSAIRFGTDAWDYNQWAGLKYSHSDKTVYLGLADGSIFTANAAQSGGKILTPGISDIYVGNNTTNKVWHAGNDGAGSGLSADYLDGYHESAFLRQGVGRLSTTAAFDIRRTCTNELYNYNPYSFDEEYGTIVTFSSGGVNFAGQFYLPRLGGSHISYRGKNDTNNTWSAWSKLAFLTDNVASATKLQTSRSLWGQSFNGTANVDGALTVHHKGAHGVYISGGGESSYSCQASGGLRWVSGAYPDRYFIWDSSNNERLSILNNGNVGIGTTSPSYKLDVIGVIHSTVGIWSNGYVSARGQNTASDARLKNILRTTLLDTRSIAAAPSVLFRWKDDGREDVGSIAQYWQRIDRHLVSHRPDGYLGLDYGKAALLSVISVAKQTLNHEARIKALEKENARLKEQIKSLT